VLEELRRAVAISPDAELIHPVASLKPPSEHASPPSSLDDVCKGFARNLNYSRRCRLLAEVLVQAIPKLRSSSP
jgi:hypothetical protein